MTTVTLGLDGASFELIDPWLSEGVLPNLQQIRTEGAACQMQSCLPPVTCPNWNCFARGRNPGNLGVFWWEAVDRERQRIDNMSGIHNFNGTPFWSVLEGSVAILNLPTSYPPPIVDGIHVAGGPGAEQTGYTHPENLERKLERKYDYQVHPEGMSLLKKDRPDSPCVSEIYDLIDKRFDLLLDELESGDYEYIHLTVFYINVLQHFYWDHEVTKTAWRRIDERIGELLATEQLNRLFILSDHGSNEIEVKFHINTWLEREGYLYTTEAGFNWLARTGITRDRLRPLLGHLGIEWWVRRLVPRRLQEALPDDKGRVKKTGKERVIDWERSTAVASGQGPVYVLAENKSERNRIRDKLVSALDGLRDESGRPVVRAATPATELYEGPHVADGPDIVLEQASNIHIDGSIGAEKIFEEPDTWRAENKDIGLFIAYGEGIDRKQSPSDMHILDVAPTVLHCLGAEVPESLDGTVRTELFSPNSATAHREVSYVEDDLLRNDRTPTDDTRAVDDRLEDLGYL